MDLSRPVLKRSASLRALPARLANGTDSSAVPAPSISRVAPLAAAAAACRPVEEARAAVARFSEAAMPLEAWFCAAVTPLAADSPACWPVGEDRSAEAQLLAAAPAEYALASCLR